MLFFHLQSSLIDLKEHASSLASSGLKKDSKLKSLEIAIEQKKEECSKLETQLQKVRVLLTAQNLSHTLRHYVQISFKLSFMKWICIYSSTLELKLSFSWYNTVSWSLHPFLYRNQSYSFVSAWFGAVKVGNSDSLNSGQKEIKITRLSGLEVARRNEMKNRINKRIRNKIH